MCGYHIRADAAGIHVSGGRDGLYGRYVLSWWLSNTLDTAFCLDALQAALRLAYLLFVWTARSRGRKALGRLTDAHLADIGLTRRDATAEAGKWFWMA